MPREHKTEESPSPAPILLPPRGKDADPASLLDTLARVALAIAQRRAARDGLTPPASGTPT